MSTIPKSSQPAQAPDAEARQAASPAAHSRPVFNPEARLLAEIPASRQAEAKAALSTNDCIIATGQAARRINADREELRKVRLKAAGGSVFKRAGSRYWQIKYRVDEKWRYETTQTKSRPEAQRLLAHKVYEASAGRLPGTATFEQIIELLVNDAKLRGLKAVKRIQRAGAALCRELAGYRAEQVDYAKLADYAARRREQVAPDTVHFELSVAARAFRVARERGLVRSVPVFPRIKNLHVRAGFVDAQEWSRLRARLEPDFRDAADFAFLCGARQMELLGLQWADVELSERVVHFRATKTGRSRPVPYAGYPQLEQVIERRVALCERLKRAGIITPWVFCFGEPKAVGGRLYHKAGDPLFKPGGDRGLLTSLGENWQRACQAAGRPGLLFHDLRRSAARNFERAGMARGVAMKLGGWTERMYSRYAIGAESEVGPALAGLSAYLSRAGWQSGGSSRKNPANSRQLMAEGGRSRTFRQA